MSRTPIALASVLAAALVLPACGERSQAQPAALKKADAKASTGAPAEPKI